MAVDNKQIAVDVLAAVGGKANVTAVQHCMTRLRFNLKDQSLVDDDAVKAVKGVAGVQRAGTQYQVIVGQNVPKVYAALCEEAGIVQQDAIDENLDADAPKEKLTLKRVGSNILDYLSGSMVQLIPILMAAALFKTLLSVLGSSFLGVLSTESDLYVLLDFVYDAGFYFIPIYLGYTAAKKIGASPVLGMFMGGILIAPDFVALAGTSFSVFGIPTTAYSYGQTVLPILLSVAALYYVEKFFKKYMPDTLSTIFTPFLTIVVMLPVSLCLLAPLGNYCGTAVSTILMAFSNVAGPLGPVAIGILWEFLVMTGMHVTLYTVNMAVYLENGYMVVAMTGTLLATFAVFGVTLGAFFRLKDKGEKGLALGYFASGILGGVTEPALYGLMFKYKRTFAGLIIGAAAGGLFAGITGVTRYVVTSGNILALLAFTGGTTSNLVCGIVACGISMLVAAVATYFLGFTKEELEGSAA